MALSTEQTPLLARAPHQARCFSTSQHSERHREFDDADDQGLPRSPVASVQCRTPRPTQMETIASQASPAERRWLFFGIFLVGYAYGLESQVRVTYAPYATSSFSLHSYLSTINVLRSVIAVACQPTAAKVADILGRFEIVVASTALYVIGMAIESTSSSVYGFCAGSLIYQVGYTSIVLLLEVLVADFSSMRARVILSYIPALPFVINTWISGNVTSAVLSFTSWRWGIGMWCIIFPVCSLPLLTTLHLIGRRQSLQKDGTPVLKDLCSILTGLRKSTQAFAKQLDLIGLITMVAAFSFILAPISIIGSTTSHWKNPFVVTSLIIGVVCVPLFLRWEQRARSPLVPFHLLVDRGVWAALAVRALLNFAWSLQGNYLYTVLIVAFDFSIGTSTRILSFFSFFGVISGVIVGLVVYKLRRLKVIIILGTILFTVAVAVLYNFPGEATHESRAGIITGQILIGVASGLFAYPTQASIQAAATREHVAILTGLYLSFYNVGSALGTCLAGAVWSQTLYSTLEQNLSFQSNRTLARDMYNSPFPVVAEYPVGTEIRVAIIDSYKYVQKLLCAAGLVVCIPMMLFAFLLRNPRLSEQQVQEEAEETNNEIER